MRNGTVTIATGRRNARLVAVQSFLDRRASIMIKRKATYFRNSLDLKDKVQVKVLRKRLRLSEAQFADTIRKSGNSIAALTKEASSKA
ncbi:DUF3606 domain-containing protein [Bradyrhizobium sp.]|uniref:DUF3606 domain-containing protein n=1 Tax=Bradyrhizobium sp. TaxID=376 RepID=UPI003C6F1607